LLRAHAYGRVISHQLFALQAQGISPSTALEQAKAVFETELEGIKKRLEDDMNQTKQLLAYGTYLHVCHAVCVVCACG
jgi:hypothetical protein